jgi:hypothetical protein
MPIITKMLFNQIAINLVRPLPTSNNGY